MDYDYRPKTFFFWDFLVYVTLADVTKMGKIGFKLFASN